MDELSGLLVELDAPPDAVWMRVLANALDPSVAHEDLSSLVPEAGDLGDLPGDPGEMFTGDPAEDDPDADPYVVWLDGLEIPAGDLDEGSTDVADPYRDDGHLDQDPDVS